MSILPEAPSLRIASTRLYAISSHAPEIVAEIIVRMQVRSDYLRVGDIIRVDRLSFRVAHSYGRIDLALKNIDLAGKDPNHPSLRIIADGEYLIEGVLVGDNLRTRAIAFQIAEIPYEPFGA